MHRFPRVAAPVFTSARPESRRARVVFPVAALVFGALPAMGCTVPSSSDNPDAEAIAQSTTAVVVVERTTGPGEAAHADNVVARFVRVQQGIVDDQVLRVVGAADDVPAPVPAMGTCTAVDPDYTESFEGRSSAARTPRGTTLLDVGAVALEDSKTSGAKGTELLPRMMPIRPAWCRASSIRRAPTTPSRPAGVSPFV